MNSLEAGLYKVEVTLSAISSGIGSEWAEDHVLAHGLSGQRNRLGNALDHLMSHPNPANANLVAFMLATEAINAGLCKNINAIDIAKDAISWWWDQKCPYCAGRGVTDFEQTQCDACGGTGHRPSPKSKQVQDVIGLINSSIQWMESQLRKRTSTY